MKMLTEISVAPELAPFWDKHARRALKAIQRFADECPTPGEKLGALGVLAHLVMLYGDSLQAIQLSKTSTATKN